LKRLKELENEEEGRAALRADRAFAARVAQILQTNAAGAGLVEEQAEPIRLKRHLVTTTAEECLGIQCPHYLSCLPKKALTSYSGEGGILVTNHHFFYHQRRMLTRLSVRTVVDEAHELPAVVRENLTRKLTRRKMTRWFNALLKADPAIDQDWAVYTMDMLLPKFSKASSRAEAVSAAADVLYFLTTKMHVFRAGGDEQARLAQSAARDYAFDLDKNGVWFFTKEEGEPVLVSPPLPEEVVLPGATGFFSATLRVGGNFDYFTRHTEAPSRAVCYAGKSPFNWSEQALLVLPGKELLADRSPSSILPEVVHRAKGRTLVLTSSWAAVRAMKEALAADPRTAGYTTYVQGEESGQGKEKLVQNFKEDVNSVLIGTLSFWTGVDVPGESLSCLVIDKIPFRSPDDPYFQRMEQAEPGSGFHKEALPQAGFLLAQGFGRLIRSEKDKGVCVLLDPRFYPKSWAYKPYTRTLLRSMLPLGFDTSMISDDIDDISVFLGTQP
jgi:ATP-dependent DNA helicase DinG